MNEQEYQKAVEAVAIDYWVTIKDIGRHVVDFSDYEKCEKERDELREALKPFTDCEKGE